MAGSRSLSDPEPYHRVSKHGTSGIVDTTGSTIRSKYVGYQCLWIGKGRILAKVGFRDEFPAVSAVRDRPWARRYAPRDGSGRLNSGPKPAPAGEHPVRPGSIRSAIRDRASHVVFAKSRSRNRRRLYRFTACRYPNPSTVTIQRIRGVTWVDAAGGGSGTRQSATELPGCAPPAAHPGVQIIPAGVFLLRAGFRTESSIQVIKPTEGRIQQDTFATSARSSKAADRSRAFRRWKFRRMHKASEAFRAWHGSKSGPVGQGRQLSGPPPLSSGRAAMPRLRSTVFWKDRERPRAPCTSISTRKRIWRGPYSNRP